MGRDSGLVWSTSFISQWPRSRVGLEKNIDLSVLRTLIENLMTSDFRIIFYLQKKLNCIDKEEATEIKFSETPSSI